MNSNQPPFLVEGLIILAAVALGFFLGREGKPYGKVKLGFHGFFFLWFTLGYFFIASAVFTAKAPSLVFAPVTIMGLAVLTQFVTGIWMLVSRKPVKSLPVVHGVSAAVLLVADLSGYFLAGVTV